MGRSESQTQMQGQPIAGGDLFATIKLGFLEAYEGTTTELTYTIPSTGDTETVDITVPAGAINGGKLRHKGYGDYGENGGDRGDLVVQTVVLDEHPYRRAGANVLIDWEIDDEVAMRGGEIEVPTPSGETVQIIVPSGSTNGSRLRVEGLGAPDVKNGGQRGDLYVILRFARVMRSVQAFVTNNTLPKDFDDFVQYLELGYRYPVESLICNEGEPEEWTAPKWCKEDDIVFFMFATRARQNLSHVRTQYREMYKDRYNEEERKVIEETFDYLSGLCKQFGGKIFAVGRVSGASFFQGDVDEDREVHWKSTIYAPISDIYQLECPIDISEFRDFLTISRVGTITPVMGSTFRQLKALIMRHNEVPAYIAKSDATPMPLMEINEQNWIEVNNIYRHSYFLEHQFRVYYVDYFLRLLGDMKTFYSESVCVSDLSDNSRVDNVIKFFGKYLCVEVKLNVQGERDLPGQCRKYCHLKSIELRQPTKGSTCYTDHVLIIDMNGLYLYEYKTHSVSNLKSLDDFGTPTDVLTFRKELHQLLTDSGLYLVQ